MSEFGLNKAEKLCSQAAINRLFESGKSQIAYPLRMVYGVSARESGAPVQFLISIPKKRIRKAVGRVLMRRRVREAYRLNRSLMSQILAGSEKIDVAFIYLSDSLTDYAVIGQKMRKLLSSLNDIFGNKGNA